MRAVPRDAARKRSPTPTPRRPQKLCFIHKRELVTQKTREKKRGIPCFPQHHRATRAGKNTKLANSTAEEVFSLLFPEKTLDAAKSEKSATSFVALVIGKPKKKRLTTFVFTSLRDDDDGVVSSLLLFLLSHRAIEKHDDARGLKSSRRRRGRGGRRRRDRRKKKRRAEEEVVVAVRDIFVSLFPNQRRGKRKKLLRLGSHSKKICFPPF
jgi:hypothetical protein